MSATRRGTTQARKRHVCACLQGAPLVAAGNVPQAHVAVTRGNEQVGPVGPADERRDAVFEAFESAAMAAGRRVPQQHLLIVAAACQCVAVFNDGKARHAGVVPARQRKRRRGLYETVSRRACLSTAEFVRRRRATTVCLCGGSNSVVRQGRR